MMGLYQQMEATVRLELTSADPQDALDEMLHMGLSLYSVYRHDELTTVFTAKRPELSIIYAIITSRGDKIRILENKGFYLILMRTLKHPILLAGLVFLFFLTVFIPTRLLLFRVEGNTTLSTSQILENIHAQGVAFGTKRKDLRSEDIKNKLISEMPQIAWAGINTKGCVAIISVRERDPEIVRDPPRPGSIFATRDGIISSVTAMKGTALCAPGDAVLEGQLLISGFSDCGNILLLEAAEGEVYAYTSRSERAVSPATRYHECSQGITQRRFSLVIGKKRINFWKGSGIPPTGCDRMYQEYWLKFPGGHVLPVCLIQETIIEHELETCRTTYSESELSDALETQVRRQMPGGQILHREISFSETNGLLIVDARFGCMEMIGRKIVEQIGDNIWQER